MISTGVRQREEQDIPSALGEKVVPAVDMDHAVLQDALPLVLNPCDLFHTPVSTEY